MEFSKTLATLNCIVTILSGGVADRVAWIIGMEEVTVGVLNALKKRAEISQGEEATGAGVGAAKLRDIHLHLSPLLADLLDIDHDVQLKHQDITRMLWFIIKQDNLVPMDPKTRMRVIRQDGALARLAPGLESFRSCDLNKGINNQKH